MKGYVFISYATPDLPDARRLAADLTALGMEVWLDQDRLLPGQPWREEIQRAIRESRFFLVLLSSRSVNRRGYVQSEITQALDALAEIPPQDIFLIPARLDQCEPAHPRLRELHWVNLFPDWKTGVHRIASAIGNDQKPSGASFASSYQKISVGCFPYPPLINWHRGQLDQDSEFDGPWINLAKELARRMNLTLDLRVISASDFADTSQIETDVVLGLFRTDHREKFFDFSVPIHRIGLQGVCRAAAPQITKEAMVQGDLKIVVQEGEVGWEYVGSELKRALSKRNVYKVNSVATSEALDMLLSGCYDLAISDEVSCMHFLRGVGADHPFRLAFARPLQIFDGCLAVKRKCNWDMENVNRHLVEARNAESFLEYEVRCLRNFEKIIERCSLL